MRWATVLIFIAELKLFALPALNFVHCAGCWPSFSVWPRHKQLNYECPVNAHCTGTANRHYADSTSNMQLHLCIQLLFPTTSFYEFSKSICKSLQIWSFHWKFIIRSNHQHWTHSIRFPLRERLKCAHTCNRQSRATPIERREWMLWKSCRRDRRWLTVHLAGRVWLLNVTNNRFLHYCQFICTVIVFLFVFLLIWSSSGSKFSCNSHRYRFSRFFPLIKRRESFKCLMWKKKRAAYFVVSGVKSCIVQKKKKKSCKDWVLSTHRMWM